MRGRREGSKLRMTVFTYETDCGIYGGVPLLDKFYAKI